MKQEFLNFLNELMAANPTLVKEKMTDNIQSFIDALQDTSVDKPEVTESGKPILAYMQKSDMNMLKAKDIANALEVSSRVVSGSLRKLVNDGFVEKIGSNPTVYYLTEKGKNYNIED